MNKAFTKESDYDPTAEVVVRPLPVLPPGVKNYITPAGAEALRATVRELEVERRPKLLESVGALVHAGRQGGKRHLELQARLRSIESRIRDLKQRLGTLEVVATRSDDDGPVRFGDRVFVLESRDEPTTDTADHGAGPEAGPSHAASAGARSYRIVGVDEADPATGNISWISPLAQALIGSQIGDEVPVRRPRGELRLQIVAIERS